jgi:Mg2+ and Co2+ transporter CorA
VHYGDSIPPQFAQKERTVLNSQGVEVRKLDAQKTPEQAAAAARTEQSVFRQKQHDAFLVNNYGSVKDIEVLRDVRLEQLRVQKSAAEQYVESLHSRLSTLQTRAKVFKPYSPRPDARRMPDDLAEDLVHTLNELRTQSNMVATKIEEEAALKAQFQADIERYRELHAVQR